MAKDLITVGDLLLIKKLAKESRLTSANQRFIDAATTIAEKPDDAEPVFMARELILYSWLTAIPAMCQSGRARTVILRSA